MSTLLVSSTTEVNILVKEQPQITTIEGLKSLVKKVADEMFKARALERNTPNFDPDVFVDELVEQITTTKKVADAFDAVFEGKTPENACQESIPIMKEIAEHIRSKL